MTNKEKIKKLEKEIKEAQNAYYNGSEIISDDEYDALIYELSILDPKNKLLSKIGAEPSQEWTKVKHLTPLGSLNKVNNANDMSKWINDTLENFPDKRTVVVEKLDGLSIGLQYKDNKLVAAALRGAGYEGENILANVLKMKGSVSEIQNSIGSFTGTIRGEIVLLKNDHLQHFPTYANPRNAASGICRSLDGKGCEHLTLMVYQVTSSDINYPDITTEGEMLEWIKDKGFILPNHYLCENADDVINIWQEYQDVKRDTLDWEIDGLVISVNDLEKQKSLGESSLRPKGKMAFKFANQYVKTTVQKIEWTVGSMGHITPLCWVEPINLLGSKISKASVYNVEYVNTLKLGVGAEVLICKAGEIIPRIEKVVKFAEKVVEIPTQCPKCQTELIMNGKHLLCPNIENCPDQKIGRLQNWVNELNLLEWGSGLLDKLMISGKVNYVSDLYRLTVQDLMSLERMGEKSAQKAYDILWNNIEINIETLLGALSIPLIGKSTIETIKETGIDTLEKFQKASISDFENAKGIGLSRATSLYNGLKYNKTLIDDLLKLGIKIKENKKMEGGKLTGKSFVITGTLSRKRDEIVADIENAGGEVKGSIQGSTTHLVIADPSSNSSKAVAARKKGITLISENELMDMINN